MADPEQSQWYEGSTNPELDRLSNVPMNITVSTERIPGQDAEGDNFERVVYHVHSEGGFYGSYMTFTLGYNYYSSPGKSGYAESIRSFSMNAIITDGRYRAAEHPDAGLRPHMQAEVNAAGFQITEKNFAHVYSRYIDDSGVDSATFLATLKGLMNRSEDAHKQERDDFDIARIPVNKRKYQKGFPTEQGGVFSYMENERMEQHAAALATSLAMLAAGLTDEYIEMYSRGRSNDAAALGVNPEDAVLILPKEITRGIIAEGLGAMLTEITSQLKPKEEIEKPLQEQPESMQPFAYLTQDPEVLSLDGGFVSERPQIKLVPEPKGFSAIRLFLQQQRELAGLAADERLGYNSVVRTLMLSPDAHFYEWVKAYHGGKLNSDLSLGITSPDDPVLRLALIFTLQETAKKKPRSAGHFAESIRHTWIYASKILQGVSDLYTLMLSRKGYALVVDRPSTSTDHYGLTTKDLAFWRHHINSGNYQSYRAAEIDTSIIEVFGDNMKTMLLSSGAQEDYLSPDEE